MEPKICLITGATDGLGKLTALALAKKDFHVVIAARQQHKAEALQKEIREATGKDLDWIGGDLGSLRQVRAIADTFRERYSRLDVLINNAGLFADKRAETEDGFEASYQINYLSHFLLTQRLLDRLKKSPQGRVINLSSSVYSVGEFRPDNLQSERKFSVLGTYAASKLLMLMFTKELARRLAGTEVTAYAAHPGIVRTRMMLNSPGAFRIISLLSLPFAISPSKGAETSVHLATSPEVRTLSGQYFTKSKPVKTKNRYDTPANRALLWDLSMQALQAHGV